MNWGKLFFSADGRTGRKDFWVTFLILVAAGLTVGWIPFVGLGLLFSSICIRTKRLHDMGRSGWTQVVPVISYIAVGVFTIYYMVGAILTGVAWNDLAETPAIVGLAIGGATLAMAWIVAMLIDLGFLLWIGLSQGEADDNRFGPEPVRPSETMFARA